jgi:hypothetical protein
MNNPITIELALLLSFLDVENLGKGLNTKILPKVPLEKGKIFLLYPHIPQTLGLEECKHLPSLDYLDQAIERDKPDSVLIQYYAECQDIDHLHHAAEIEDLALEQQWSADSLQKLYNDRGNFLFGSGSLSVASIQVYQLPQPLIAKPLDHPKLGKFSGLRPLNLDPQLKIENPIAIVPLKSKANQNWIKTIADLGNRAKEDQPKSTYQAGTDFENITAQALSFLGFTIDRNHHGGAGGLDLFCSQPFPLAGECKSGQSIPDTTINQLIRIAKRHLKDDYESASLFIIGPGKPTSQLKESALYSKVSIMKPETLQKLAELQAQYPGAIDLFKLKEHLKAGQIDEEIQTFIDRAKQDIAIRRSIIAIVKDNPEDATPSTIRIYYKTTYKPDPNLPDLTDQEIRDILIELSSPLTGYLGRKAGSDGSDRFYFRTDLSTLHL